MADKPADRNAEAPSQYSFVVRPRGNGKVTEYVDTDSMHVEIKRQLNAAYGKTAAPKPDKAHVYVNGRHKLSTDMSRAHEVAETYAKHGDSVWVTRRAVTK